MKKIRAIDMFCGAGGSAWGARRAGVEIVAGFDRWTLARDTYQDNFPNASFFRGRVENCSAKRIARDLGPIDLILASPECTSHSPAKGKMPRCERSRDTAFQVTRFAKALKPRWIVVENVVGMRQWRRYPDFISRLKSLGYHVSEQVLNSSDFAVPQARRRLFILCDRRRKPATVNPRQHEAKLASGIVDRNRTYEYTELRSKIRAAATIERADRAIAEIGVHKPFLLVYYGSDHAGGWQRLDRPLRTITTVDRFALVRPRTSGHVMRMLQPPELKKAMGMPSKFRIERGSRRERIKLIGNAVCPPVMRWVVTSLTKGAG